MVRQIVIPVVLQPRSRHLWSENGQHNGIVYDYCAQHCLSAHVHCGHDVEAIFEPIFAATDGVVKFAGFDGFYTPRHVDIEPIVGPFRGEYHIYGHLSESWVATGQRVTRGQQIGLTGTNCTDRTCSALAVGNEHLHWERRAIFAGCSLDPDPVLSGQNANGGEGVVDGDMPSGGFQRQDAIRVADGPLRLRLGPGFWFSVLQEVPNGAQMCVTGESFPRDGFDWYPVLIPNINLAGWVAGQHCVLESSGGCSGAQETAPAPEGAALPGRPMNPHPDSGAPGGVVPEMTEATMPMVEYDADGVFVGVSIPEPPPMPETTPAAGVGASPFAKG
ncbi:MAG: peptidoglycan DD-metalloendopeptidase family protein [Thermomicrobiales bacterium]